MVSEGPCSCSTKLSGESSTDGGSTNGQVCGFMLCKNIPCTDDTNEVPIQEREDQKDVGERLNET
ncbi:hypothetical protein C0J52_12883 [Blattella germanica]|nr:hypothetical protein C0J52_12883 [Blattella germanica]